MTDFTLPHQEATQLSHGATRKRNKILFLDEQRLNETSFLG